MTALDTELHMLRPDDGTTAADEIDQSWSDGFTVTDRRTAEYAIRRIAKAHLIAEADSAIPCELIAGLQARIDYLQAIVEDEHARAADTVAHFEALLIAWHRSVYAADSRAKSVRLSGGTLKSRAGTDRVTVDQDADLDGLLAVSNGIEGGGFARSEIKLDRRRLLAYVKSTGDLPDGVSLDRATEDDRRFTVEVTTS